MNLREYRKKEREKARLEGSLAKLAPVPTLEETVTQVYHRRHHGYALHRPEKSKGGRGEIHVTETLGKKDRPYWEVSCQPCGPLGRALTNAGAQTLGRQHLKAQHPGHFTVRVHPLVKSFT